jgi:uncharacterized integral membrane protein (TIGR00698 family)
MTMSVEQSGIAVRLKVRLSELFPGVIVAVVVAIAAQFISEHYGAPAMLMALLLGIALNFVGEEGACAQGVAFAAKYILRFGVALLGARISVEMLTRLGPELVTLVIAAVAATILFGAAAAYFLRSEWRLALLTAGSVAICGASAAMAISAVLPRNEHSERNLIFTVLSVTVLSTIAMIAYPILSHTFGFSHREAGVFLGGTIHDVAQVIGAGFSVSPETGETATLVKLIRVSMLGPVVLIFSLGLRLSPLAPEKGKRPPLLPGFVAAFFALAALNSFGFIPQGAGAVMNSVSRWALVTAISAVGMKTSLKNIFEVGGPAIALVVAETVFIGVFVLAGLRWLG